MADTNFEQDFELMADDLESVTLSYANSIEQYFVEKASRRHTVAQEFGTSGEAVVQADAVWHLQLPASAIQPRIGDVIVDQQKNRWTILRTEWLKALGRCRCTTRELRLAHGCHQLVDVRRPIWDDIGSGPEIIGWQAVCAALPASIRLDEMTLDTSTNPPTRQMRYEIVLGEWAELLPDDRIVDANGQSYQLQTLKQAPRIDALPVVVALREDPI
ncbi:MAG: hypothetical protein AAGD11_03045 [Planctomycetota bacterium]